MRIANTLSGLVEHPHVQAIMDKTASIDDVIEDVLNWRRQGFVHRHPSSAHNSRGEFRGTDLDLLTFMTSLEERKAVINIQDYEEQRPITYHFDEEIVSPEDRHGRILSLEGNSKVFAFSVKIFDESVKNVKTGRYGSPRSYFLTDFEGNNLENMSAWQQSVTSLEENEFFRWNKVISHEDDLLRFKYSVHPNSWQSIYGEPCNITSMAAVRVRDEAQWYRWWSKHLGKIFPIIRDGRELYEPPKKSWQEPGEMIKVPTLEFEIYFPMHGVYPTPEHTAEGRTFAYQRSNWLSYVVLKKLNYSLQAARLGFWRWGDDGNNKPSWSVPDWQRNISFPGRTKKLSIMDYGNGIMLGYRPWRSKQTINKLLEN